MSSTAAQPAPVIDVQGDGRWNSMHKHIIEDCRLLKPQVLCVGDSLIQHMGRTESWDTLFQPLHAVNAGIGGDCTQHVLWRLQNGVLDACNPQVAVVLAGTNNYANTCEEIVEGIEAIAWCIGNNVPACKIIVLALLPRGEKPNSLREKIYRINHSLKDVLVTVPNTYFLDADPGFIRTDGNISRDDMHDYLHLTKRGYSKLCVPLVGMIKKLLSDGTHSRTSSATSNS